MSRLEGCGVYLPETRLETARLMEFHGRSGRPGCQWLAVPDLDEDCITMGYEAAMAALDSAGILGGDVQGLVWGSLSPPFAYKSAGAVLAKALGLPDEAVVLGLGSSGKLAGESVLAAHSLVEAGLCRRCLVVCTDYLPLGGEQTLALPSSAGAAALVLSDQGFAELAGWAGHLGEAYDFWQLPGDAKPRYDRAAYGAAFSEASTGALRSLFAKMGVSPGDLAGLALDAPDAKMAAAAAKTLGLAGKPEGEALAMVGHLFSASMLFGLAEAFESCPEGGLIASSSYGSGSSQALLWRVDGAVPHTRIKSCLGNIRPITVARHQEVSGC